MIRLQRILFLPSSFWGVITRKKEARPKPVPRSQPPSESIEKPKESRRYRLERECSNYRSIHFPR